MESAADVRGAFGRLRIELDTSGNALGRARGDETLGERIEHAGRRRIRDPCSLAMARSIDLAPRIGGCIGGDEQGARLRSCVVGERRLAHPQDGAGLVASGRDEEAIELLEDRGVVRVENAGALEGEHRFGELPRALRRRRDRTKR